MRYTKQQQKYLDSVDGNAHMSALKIIGLMEKTLKAQSRLLITYKVGGRPPEWVLNDLEKAQKHGLEI